MLRFKQNTLWCPSNPLASPRRRGFFILYMVSESPSPVWTCWSLFSNNVDGFHLGRISWLIPAGWFPWKDLKKSLIFLKSPGLVEALLFHGNSDSCFHRFLFLMFLTVFLYPNVFLPHLLSLSFLSLFFFPFYILSKCSAPLFLPPSSIHLLFPLVFISFCPCTRLFPTVHVVLNTNTYIYFLPSFLVYTLVIYSYHFPFKNFYEDSVK